MKTLPVFTERPGQGFVRMQQAAPPDENELQHLIATHPDVIAGRGEPLLLIKREQGVPDQLDGSHRFSLDNLFVTRSAVPVLVEVKQATNTQVRREVIGQLLDYAANGSAYWRPGTLEEEFRKQSLRDGGDPDEILRDFLPEDDHDDGGARFWEQVDSNLASGRMRLVVVADIIPPQLARVIEFLNEQMRATVLAVELTYFQGESGLRTLVPKVIGETERAQAAKSAVSGLPHGVSVEDWVENHAVPRGETFVEACQTLFTLVESLGGQTEVCSNPKELSFAWSRKNGKVLRPLYCTQGGKVGICFAHLQNKAAFSSIDARQDLYDKISGTVGGLSTQNLQGYPSFDVTYLLKDTVLDGFSEQLKFIVAQCAETG